MAFPVETIFFASAPVFLLLGLGFLLRHVNALQATADGALTHLVVRVFYPCLFLKFIVGNSELKALGTLLTAPVMGFLTVLLGFAVAFAMARVIGLQRGKGLRSFAFSGGIFNYGYIPVPLMAVLFDDPVVLGVLLAFKVGVELAIWTVGIVLLSGSTGGKALLKRLINPPLIAFLVAVCMNTSGLDAAVPLWLDRAVEMLAGCAIPIGLLLAGAGIRDLVADGGLIRPIKVPAAGILVRLLLVPLLMVSLALLLPGISEPLRYVLIIQAAMPAGIFPIVLTRHFGGEPRVATQVVLSTTLLSILTMPLWILFGLSFLA